MSHSSRLRELRVMVVVLSGLLGLWLYFLFSPSVTSEKGEIYYLRPGTSPQQFISELSEQGIIKHPYLYALYVYPQSRHQLKTGEYLFRNGSSPFSIWQQVTQGLGLYLRPFMIVPGWTFKQLREAVDKTETLRHTTKDMTDAGIMALMSDTLLKPEGQFFPETYYYTRDVQDLVILKRAFDLMQAKIHEAWESRVKDLPFKTIYDALIAASLIEKEAYLNTERPKIAGVLVNRLRKKMMLQFDPTVIYGLGERYDGKIHKKDLQEDTDYNTYKHTGLPPTPIAIPSWASIEAVMRPEINDYLYFVAKGDGSHQFSKTLTEHNKAVAASIKKG